MGILDTTEHGLVCKHCGVSETIIVLDKGSIWGGSSWTIPDSRNFSLEWEGGGQEEPKIVKATCKNCGVTIIP